MNKKKATATAKHGSCWDGADHSSTHWKHLVLPTEERQRHRTTPPSNEHPTRHTIRNIALVKNENCFREVRHSEAYHCVSDSGTFDVPLRQVPRHASHLSQRKTNFTTKVDGQKDSNHRWTMFGKMRSPTMQLQKHRSTLQSTAQNTNTCHVAQVCAGEISNCNAGLNPHAETRQWDNDRRNVDIEVLHQMRRNVFRPPQ